MTAGCGCEARIQAGLKWSKPQACGTPEQCAMPRGVQVPILKPSRLCQNQLCRDGGSSRAGRHSHWSGRRTSSCRKGTAGGWSTEMIPVVPTSPAEWRTSSMPSPGAHGLTAPAGSLHILPFALFLDPSGHKQYPEQSKMYSRHLCGQAVPTYAGNSHSRAAPPVPQRWGGMGAVGRMGTAQPRPLWAGHEGQPGPPGGEIKQDRDRRDPPKLCSQPVY